MGALWVGGEGGVEILILPSFLCKQDAPSLLPLSCHR